MEDLKSKARRAEAVESMIDGLKTRDPATMVEHQLIGEMFLCELQAIESILGLVSPSHFVDPLCQAVWRWFGDRRVQDPVECFRYFSPILLKQESLASWLGHCVESASGLFDFASLRARQLLEFYRKRELEALSYDLRGDRSSEEIIADIENRVAQLRAIKLGGRKDTMNVAVDFLDSVSTGSRRENAPYTGILKLDELYRFDVGSNTVIGAKTSVGKSAVLQRIGLNFAQKGWRVALFSCEMSQESVVERLMVMMSGHTHRTFDNAHMWSDTTRSELAQAANDLGQLPIDIYYCPGWTVERIESEVAAMALKNPYQVVMVDYSQLVSSEERYDSREQLCSDVALKIVQIGGKYNCCTFNAAQLSLAPGKEPSVDSIRDSKAIGHHADNLIFLSRDKTDSGEDSAMKFYCRKNRNGPLGVFEVPYHPPTYRLGDPQELAF